MHAVIKLLTYLMYNLEVFVLSASRLRLTDIRSCRQGVNATGPVPELAEFGSHNGAEDTTSPPHPEFEPQQDQRDPQQCLRGARHS